MECHLCHLRFDARRRRFLGDPESKGALLPGSISLSAKASGRPPERFCSGRCLKRWQAGWRAARCGNCCECLPGEPVRNARLFKREPVFCSSGCVTVYRLRIEGTFPPDCASARADWRSSSGRIKFRDHNTCQVCGIARSKAILHVDHIVPYILSKRDDPENLLTLCVRCHGFKTDRLEPWLLSGRIGSFLIKLRQAGWPMTRIRSAFKLYDLPTHERERPMRWSLHPSGPRWPRPPGARKRQYLLRMFAD